MNAEIEALAEALAATDSPLVGVYRSTDLAKGISDALDGLAVSKAECYRRLYHGCSGITYSDGARIASILTDQSVSTQNFRQNVVRILKGNGRAGGKAAREAKLAALRAKLHG